MIACAITSKSKDLAKVEHLYKTAFPEQERGPFSLLLDDETHCSEVFAFYEQDEFCGFLSLFTMGDISHILYFAIEESMRGKHLGETALSVLKEIKPQHRLLADIEQVDKTAKNAEQRTKRKQFYLRQGFATSGVNYVWRKEAYEVLVYGGTLTNQDFWGFWKSVTNQNQQFDKF